MMRFIIPIVIASSLLTACGDSELDKVKEQSLDNFIFVKGGTFTMGDFGRTIDGKHYNLAIGRGMEPHQVTLSSYSLGKYQVTWFDYDTFLLATNRPVLSFQRQQIGKPISNGWGEPRSPYSKVTMKKITIIFFTTSNLLRYNGKMQKIIVCG